MDKDLNKKNQIKTFVGMPKTQEKIKKVFHWTKKNTIITSIIILVAFAVGIYFLIPVIKKWNQQRIQKERLERNIKEGEWLRTQVIPMTEEEKMEIGKRLSEESKKMKPLTEEQKKNIGDFINN